MRRTHVWRWLGWGLVLLVAVVLLWRGRAPLDEARRASRSPATLRAADEDYFRDMDGGLPLTPAEIRGRDTWVVWTGGNDRFWDAISRQSFGGLDLLKTVSSHPKLKYGRHNRWYHLGLVNEPCFVEATGPHPERFGLWLDRRRGDCPEDPFESEAKYPGVALGARGKTVRLGSYYGYATGVVGLRLFPNPDFDEKAARDWDPVKYYEDPAYYERKDLIKPYRVGMSCGFCHIGPNPVRPPEDPENPKWENLSNNVGAQYFWVDRIFDWRHDPDRYLYQMFHTSRPGTLDTSLVSTDNINNPRTMNAIYQLGPRLEQALRFGRERLAGGGVNNKQLNDFVPVDSPLARFFKGPATVYSPRVLKDAADSVGALGALNRVYLNIGLFSEEWTRHFRPLAGGKKVTPIEIAVARRNSSYWQATEAQTPDLALFFLKTATPHRLKDAPGGLQYMNGGHPEDPAYVSVVERGKVVFAETCARCHSSKLPPAAEGLDPDGCAGPHYLECWNKYWNWTESEGFKAQMRAIVLAPDFLENNYLSAEHRVPVTLLQTNACSPLATNAIAGNIWDNFSSQTYKELPAVGEITVYNPADGTAQKYKMPGGGRGYTRPASLISLWSTAPYLLNNSVGTFDPSPSVEARVASFEVGIEQMLWPERRQQDAKLGSTVHGTIDRTTEISYLRIPKGFVPEPLQDWGPWLAPALFQGDDFVIGPIPKGTPVGLLTNLLVRPEETSLLGRVQRDRELKRLVLELEATLERLGPVPPHPDAREAFNQQALAAFRPFVPRLMEFSKCPDYVVNRGHYFGRDLHDEDKRALIEFLKTF